MIEQSYEYELELISRASDGILGRSRIAHDFIPVREHLAFELLRWGLINQPGEMPCVRIEPIWENQGESTARGFRASVTVGGEEYSRSWSIAYFRPQARRASLPLIDAGKLKGGELFDYRVFAVDCPQPAHRRFRTTSNEMPLAIRAASLATVMRDALLFGVDSASDIPVFIDWSVLEQTAALTRRTRPNETGGLLLGRLCRDASLPELFLHISKQIPAKKAVGELTKLSFTPAAWTSLRADADPHGSDLLWAGWWHNHSYTHQDASREPDADPQGRRVATVFLSEDDLNVHRVCFSSPYCVALLLTDSPDSGLAFDLFGWRNAIVAARACHVLGAPLHCFEQGETHEPQQQYAGR